MNIKHKAILATRLILGLIFFVFGLNGLLMFTTGSGFIPMPPPPPEMMEAMGGLTKLTYLMPLVKVLEVVAGALLLLGIYKRAALVMLGPIVVNIFAVHTFVDPSGFAMGFAVLALTLVMIASEWKDGFCHLLKK